MLGLLLSGPHMTAQIPAAAHPDDYVSADIEYGARLFAAQCTSCHGETGDGVSGVDLRSGKFKNRRHRSAAANA